MRSGIAILATAAMLGVWAHSSTFVGGDTLQTTNVADGDTVQSIQEPPVEPKTGSTISGTVEIRDASTGQRISVGIGPWATKTATPRIE